MGGPGVGGELRALAAEPWPALGKAGGRPRALGAQLLRGPRRAPEKPWAGVNTKSPSAFTDTVPSLAGITLDSPCTLSLGLRTGWPSTITVTSASRLELCVADSGVSNGVSKV